MLTLPLYPDIHVIGYIYSLVCLPLNSDFRAKNSGFGPNQGIWGQGIWILFWRQWDAFKVCEQRVKLVKLLLRRWPAWDHGEWSRKAEQITVAIVKESCCQWVRAFVQSPNETTVTEETKEMNHGSPSLVPLSEGESCIRETQNQTKGNNSIFNSLQVSTIYFSPKYWPIHKCIFL